MSGLRRVLLGAILLRLFLAAAVPPGEAPDERAHAEFVRFLAEERRLPVQTERTGEGDRYEYYQPPLFYVLAAPLHSIAGGGDRALYAVRVLNAILSVLTVAAGARFVRTWAPDRPSLPVGVAAFLAFHPSFAANGSAVNNDALLVLLSTLALERLGHAVRTPRLRPIDRLASTLLLAAALLTKVSGAVLLPVVGLGLLVARGGLRGCAEAAGVGCGAALLASPWYLRNLLVYGGLLPHEIANVPWGDRPPALEAAAWEAGYAARTFWVSFGRHNEVEVEALRPLLFALGAVLLLVFARWAGREVRFPDRGRRALALAAYTGVVLLLAFVASFGWRYGQSQGRFLFPVLAPLAAAAVSTLEEVAGPGRFRRIPALLAGTFLALLGAELLGAFLPKFYPSVLPW
ncbi:MAG: glycosyltransferase family 39 protein [Planctomycetes bacterium]|nr:glycosyltransferase family 39 protein [Planctomycetota bacterium]